MADKSKPLRGLTFCCTGIPAAERKVIDSSVAQLGGVHYSDLMSDVQYLIVGTKTTDKYVFCVKNRMDIVFLRSNAIEKIHNLWESGHAFDLNDYKLPIFSNLSICLSRINYDPKDPAFGSDNLLKVIQDNGGTVASSLVTNSDCLITNDDTGKRYTKAIEWNIPVVHPLWVKYSLARRASADMQDFLLSKYPNYPTLAPGKKLKSNNTIWDSIMNKPITVKESTLLNQWEDISADPELTDPIEPSSDVLSKPTSRSGKTEVGLFKNLKFKFFGFDTRQIKILTDIISSNGGRVTESGTPSYLLIPFNHAFPPFEVSVPVRTEWFIERSIYYKKIVDDGWSDPIEVRNIPSDFHFSLSLSGFKGVESLHLTQLATALKFELNETFSSNTNLLIVNINMFRNKLADGLFYLKDIIGCEYNSINLISTKNKINAAKKWRTPVLSISYLFELARANSSDTFQLPDYRKLQWCVYSAHDSNNALCSYYESKAAVSAATADSVSDSITLPSPTKPKQKRKYGKLVVTGEKSLNLEVADIDNIAFDDDNQIGIGYQNDSSHLLNKLKKNKLDQHACQ